MPESSLVTSDDGNEAQMMSLQGEKTISYPNLSKILKKRHDTDLHPDLFRPKNGKIYIKEMLFISVPDP
jgi:hypothetical protein